MSMNICNFAAAVQLIIAKFWPKWKWNNSEESALALEQQKDGDRVE